MARKKSAKTAARTFKTSADGVVAFADAILDAGLSAEHVSWGHDLAIIRLYSHFEKLMLEALTCAVNNDTTTISQTTGLKFPKHLSDEVCEYLIVGTRYFDFKGRDGLLRELRRFVPAVRSKKGAPARQHYLITVVGKAQYKKPLERLVVLRNFAAHESKVGRKAAMGVLGASGFGSAGAWLKVSGRLDAIVDPLKRLADDIEKAAPY